jgi:hypothetical protein
VRRYLLFSKCCKVLLPSLESLNFGIGSTLEIHSEPKNGDYQARHTCGDVLRRL